MKTTPNPSFEATPREKPRRRLNFTLDLMKRVLFALFLIAVVPLAFGAEKYLVTAYPKVCKQGLYKQPAGGPFAVFLFCDDAFGSNIGVINVSGGAGPGKIPLPEPKEWSNWDVNDRFWQIADWATDVTSFAWSPDLRFLYVATSEIYGTGTLYKLDLTNRTYEALPPTSEAKIDVKLSGTKEIVGIDKKNGQLTVAIDVIREPSQKAEIETFRLIPVGPQLFKWVPKMRPNPSINADAAR